ncbi:MAG: glycosyl transferase [Paludibacteraceae bacterium]|nr:glycosyl transferase [Paludibacteraceae bacterium]
MFKKVKRYLRDPYYSFGNLFLEKCPNLMPDKWFLQIIYRAYMGKELNLEEPKNFNEKLNWLKLYDRKTLYTTLVDKLAVKDYVANKIGAEYIIPTLKVYDSAEGIIIEDLPEQFVLKCNHDSGSFIICKDKGSFDLEAAKQKLTACLKQNFYLLAREWPYKNVPRKIFAERYMSDSSQKDILTCCKFFCFNGEPKIFQLTDKSDDIFENFYDLDGNLLDLSLGYRRDETRQLPKLFGEMLSLTKELLKDINAPHIRVDLYEIGGKIYFGEFTFFNWGGFNSFEDEHWNDLLGSWINLKQK